MAKAPKSDRPDAARPAGSATNDLAARIARARQEGAEIQSARSARQSGMTGMGRGFRLATEFIAAILVGGVLGYALDVWLGTQPIALVVLLLIGFAAGVLNVIRAASEMNASSPPPADAGIVPDDEDDE